MVVVRGMISVSLAGKSSQLQMLTRGRNTTRTGQVVEIARELRLVILSGKCARKCNISSVDSRIHYGFLHGSTAITSTTDNKYN